MPKTVSFCHPADLNKGPICGVLATAIATGINFQTAFDFYKKSKSPRWKGGLYPNEIRNGIEEFGGYLEEIRLRKWDDKKVSLVNTVKELHERYPNQLFIVFVRSHVVTAYNGKIIDQSQTASADKFWCRQWKVDSFQGIFRVVGAVVDASQFVETGTVRADNLNKHRKLPADSQYKNKTEGAKAIFEEWVDRGYCPKAYINYILNDYVKKLNMKVATAKTYYYKIAKEKGYSFSRYDW